jgi:hypothetical protein
MIDRDHAEQRPLARVTVPGATLTAQLVTDTRDPSRREVWVFVTPADRRLPILLHMSMDEWQAFVEFAALVHRSLPVRAEVLSTDVTHRGAFR